MIGERFTRLRVSKLVGTRNYKRIWKCICDCGNTVQVATGQLRSGRTKSCGCLKLDMLTKHGQYKTRTYSIWRAMLNRCHLKQHRKYYSKVRVTKRWLNFSNFHADMGDAPDGLTLDRIDNNGNYEPGNCRWATRTIQLRNTRRRIEYEFNGKRRSLMEWAEVKGMSYERLRGRIRRGWSFEHALTAN